LYVDDCWVKEDIDVDECKYISKMVNRCVTVWQNIQEHLW